MKSDFENINILEDEKEKKINHLKSPTLKRYYLEDNNILEIGVDEAGRGPLFGRVYAAAVILPKDETFDHSKMKDSKKFHSKKKIEEVANYIKENALAWFVSYEDENVIDEINILQATQKAMHECIKKIIQEYEKQSFQLLIDGNYFNPIKIFNNKCEFIPHVCIEGGDNKYSAIAAASILAKVSRDKYIDDLVEENPYLTENYGIGSNKGYGAKKHMDGIKNYGITPWHRKTFGICKNYI